MAAKFVQLLGWGTCVAFQPCYSLNLADQGQTWYMLLQAASTLNIALPFHPQTVMQFWGKDEEKQPLELYCVLAFTGRVRAYEELSHCQNYLKAVCYNIPSSPWEADEGWKGAGTTPRPWVQVALGHGKSFEDEGPPLWREDLMEAASLLALAP